MISKNTMYAIAHFMLMLSLIFLIMCVFFLSGSKSVPSVLLFFFISVLPLEIQLSKGEEGFNLSSWLWLWRTKTWITISMCFGLFLGSMIWGINCGRAKPLRVFPLDNWISNNNIDINKRINTYTYSLPLNNTTYYHKNEVHHKHGQYNTRVNQCA